MSHDAQPMECEGWNPGFCAYQVSILPNPQPWFIFFYQQEYFLDTQKAKSDFTFWNYLVPHTDLWSSGDR